MKPETVLPGFLALIAAVLMLTGYIMQVRGQATKSAMISADTAIILEDMKTRYPGQGIIVNSFTLSLWVSALTE